MVGTMISMTLIEIAGTVYILHGKMQAIYFTKHGNFREHAKKILKDCNAAHNSSIKTENISLLDLAITLFLRLSFSYGKGNGSWFLENFIKSCKISLITYRNLYDDQAVLTRGNHSSSQTKVQSPVSQAAACDGNNYTTSGYGQEITPGTLPIY